MAVSIEIRFRSIVGTSMAMLQKYIETGADSPIFVRSNGTASV